MFLAVIIFLFVCALILFAYFFGRFAGEQDTAKLANAMRQMNYARIIPFPGIKSRRRLNAPESLLESDIVSAAPPGEVLVLTGCKSKNGQIGQKARGIAKGTTA